MNHKKVSKRRAAFLFALAIPIALAFTGCAEEPLIDNTKPSSAIVFTQATPDLALGSARLYKDSILDRTRHASIGAPATSIVAFRDRIFYLMEGQASIAYASRDTLSKVAAIALPSGLVPKKLALANATTMYVVFEQDTTIGLVDIFANTFVRRIPIGAIASSIAIYENQVFIACSSSDELVRLDTRNNQIQARYQMTGGPVDVEIEPDGTNLFVACQNRAAGAGAPKISVFNAKTLQQGPEFDLDAGGMAGSQGIGPMVVSPGGWGYIVVGGRLLQFDARSAAVQGIVAEKSYNGLMFAPGLNAVLCVAGGVIDGYDVPNASLIASWNFGQTITAIGLR